MKWREHLMSEQTCFTNRNLSCIRKGLNVFWICRTPLGPQGHWYSWKTNSLSTSTHEYHIYRNTLSTKGIGAPCHRRRLWQTQSPQTNCSPREPVAHATKSPGLWVRAASPDLFLKRDYVAAGSPLRGSCGVTKIESAQHEARLGLNTITSKFRSKSHDTSILWMKPSFDTNRSCVELTKRGVHLCEVTFARNLSIIELISEIVAILFKRIEWTLTRDHVLCTMPPCWYDSCKTYTCTPRGGCKPVLIFTCVRTTSQLALCGDVATSDAWPSERSWLSGESRSSCDLGAETGSLL